MTLRLFAVLVGGQHDRALIEVHDVQFVVAERIEDAAPALRQRWWGTPASLHIDAYAEIDAVDGYRVEPAPKTDLPPRDLSLFFVNTAGYVSGAFSEEHAYSFHIGTNRQSVWAAAKARS